MKVRFTNFGYASIHTKKGSLKPQDYLILDSKEDSKLIDLLSNTRAYRHLKREDIAEQEKAAEPTVEVDNELEALKEKADTLGVKYKKNVSKATLAEMIAVAEQEKAAEPTVANS